MKRWLQRVRGILGLGTLWGLAGSVVGAIAGLVFRISGGLPPGDFLIDWILGAGSLGFLLFSGPLRSVISIGEMIPVFLGAAGAYGALTAGLASATVWAARRAPSQLHPGAVSDEPELLGEPGKG